jgi:hypothetical protein
MLFMQEDGELGFRPFSTWVLVVSMCLSTPSEFERVDFQCAAMLGGGSMPVAVQISLGRFLGKKAKQNSDLSNISIT